MGKTGNPAVVTAIEPGQRAFVRQAQAAAFEVDHGPRIEYLNRAGHGVSGKFELAHHKRPGSAKQLLRCRIGPVRGSDQRATGAPLALSILADCAVDDGIDMACIGRQRPARASGAGYSRTKVSEAVCSGGMSMAGSGDGGAASRAGAPSARNISQTMSFHSILLSKPFCPRWPRAMTMRRRKVRQRRMVAMLCKGLP